MTEEQAERIIKLLEDMSSKLEDIKNNTNDLSTLTSNVFILDEIYKSLKERD